METHSHTPSLPRVYYTEKPVWILSQERREEKAARLVQQHRPVDRPPVSNVTLHAEMMRKTDKARFSTGKKKKKRHAEAVLLIPQLKLSFIKRNKKVTEWLSLGLLGRLLQT